MWPGRSTANAHPRVRVHPRAALQLITTGRQSDAAKDPLDLTLEASVAKDKRGGYETRIGVHGFVNVAMGQQGHRDSPFNAL